MILPNTVHSFEVKENECCEFLHIHFNSELFAHILVKKTPEFSISLTDALLFHCNFYYKQASNVTLFNLVTSIVGIHQNPNSYSAISNNLYVAQLMLYILEDKFLKMYRLLSVSIYKIVIFLIHFNMLPNIFRRKF